MKKLLYWIWSHWPVFCLSDDANFGTLEYGKKATRKRFSLICIMVGSTICYLITKDFNEKKWRLLQVIRLKDMEGIRIDEDLKKKTDEYRFHVQALTEKDAEIEREKLCYHIENETSRINTSMEKITIYSSVIMAALPLWLAMIDWMQFVYMSLGMKILASFIIYSILNICAYIYDGIKVQGISKSSFRDLKLNKYKDKEISAQYYYDWQQLKYKAQWFVSIVDELQKWIICFLILVVCFSVLESNVLHKNLWLHNRKDIDQVITVEIGEIFEPYSEGAVKWQSLLLDVEKKSYEKLIFIVKERENFSLDSVFDKYADLEIIVMEDSLMGNDQMKIIREESR